MKKRYTVLGLSVVLALALAVPAFGGPSNPLASASSSVKGIATKALKKAKAAQKTANSALSSATAAGTAASAASTEAAAALKEAKAGVTAGKNAQTTANTANTTANAAKSAAAAAQASANTAKTTADGKMSGEVNVGGETGGAGNGIASVGCPTGKVPTGGGFIINGTDNNAANVTESTQYVNGWLVIVSQIKGTTGSNWTTTATVNCATSP